MEEHYHRHGKGPRQGPPATAHLSLSAFVLQAAEAHAGEVLADRPMIQLSQEAAEAFSTALAAPGQVSERLAAVLRRERKFQWLD